MNILIINHYAGSLEFGMEFRPYYMAREWVKQGHKVRIIAADFSHLRSKNPQNVEEYEITEIDSVEYQWIHTSSYSSNGVKRAISIFEFCSKLFIAADKIAKSFKPDVVISSSTYPLDTYPARRIASKSGAKYIFEGHDLWPLTLTELMGMSKLNPFVIMMAISENSAYKKADHVVSLLPYAWKHMLKHGLKDKDHFTNIPNGIVVEDWNDPEPLPDEHKNLIDSLKKDNKRIVCYLGGHAPSNALDTLIDAALKTSNPDVAYVLVGNGNQKESLIKRAGGAKNIHFLGPVPKKSVPNMLSAADFLYIGAEKCPLYEFGVSMNKVYDYMMAAKPIIYGVEAANNDVEDAGCGKMIKSGDAMAIVDAVNEFLLLSDDELEEMGRNGKKAVMEKYNYHALASKFIELIEKI